MQEAPGREGGEACFQWAARKGPVLASFDAHGSTFPESSPAVGIGGIFMVYNLKGKEVV